MATERIGEPARRSGRPKGADSEARKQQILNDSMALFIEHGYHGVSMSMVARTCGISPTGLAHYFPSKELLLGEILRRRDAADAAATVDANATRPGAGWKHIDWLKELVVHNENQPQMLRLFTTMAGEATNPDHPARPWLLEHHFEARIGIEQSIRTSIQNGEVREDAPVEEIARLIVAALDGLQIQYLSDDSYNSMSKSFALLVDTLFAQYKV